MLMHSPPGDGQLVSLTGAGVRRQGRWLVRGIDLSIRRGEIVTLIGPNGAGKSTTAKLAIGVLKPDEGAVSRSGSLTIGYVPQKLSIDWTMPLTVERLMHLTGRLSQPVLQEALTAVGIPHLLKAEVQHLSGGEFQRALLARAIARKPDLLVLDEPVQGVDFAGETTLYDLIGRLRDTTGCGILMISHDLHVVMASTDTVICLNGHICCRGTPDAVSQSADYRQLFGGAARGLAFYDHRHDHEHLPDGRVRHSDGSVTDHCHPDDGHHADDGAHDHAHTHAHSAGASSGAKNSAGPGHDHTGHSHLPPAVSASHSHSHSHAHSHSHSHAEDHEHDHSRRQGSGDDERHA
ncbi:ATP-binding cassette domain-containing protein [Rhizobium sp. SAFR-030]|uniref:ATP-binding cassette domain-containing protein n=1 Tax=Rhizobium sp. SAFR-030 TaxID=3387277 RepID=UPI003F8079D7